MKNKAGKRFLALFFMTVLILLQTSCGLVILDEPYTEESKYEVERETKESAETENALEKDAGFEESKAKETAEEEPSLPIELPEELPVEGECYYDVENVVLYIYLYEELPLNYLTKSQARELGWEGGSVEKYMEGAAIGGDRFGNREGLLPEADGRKYTECDIDTIGEKSRGAKRLVFSDDGLFFYTEDHYESFDEVVITDDYEVIW